MCNHVHMLVLETGQNEMKNIGISNKKSNIAHPQHLGKNALFVFVMWSYCTALC